MSRRSRHGRRPQADASAQPAGLGTATAPETGEPSNAAVFAQPPRVVEPTPEPAAVVPMPVAVVSPPAAAVPVPAQAPSDSGPEGEAPRTTCTQAQLRRFIKSRPWIPMHELRRRFGIYGGDDDVTPVRTANGMIFVGLPSTEGRLLGELLVNGDVGYELSLDPGAPIVVGVYPMRPVPRG
jgi:hypothetical protein